MVLLAGQTVVGTLLIQASKMVVKIGVVTLALLSSTLFIILLSLINDLWDPFCKPQTHLRQYKVASM